MYAKYCIIQLDTNMMFKHTKPNFLVYNKNNRHDLQRVNKIYGYP